ncbi:hypothetical protein OS493_037644 [Desmophyllum pertusum]|uniref:Uncharacterized protein n=1 Tax=Desmophyllum pertusum TaxID=174260 RepID=A0A9X0CJ04_9CNID|nr:hypothetical protein OS493_037644 [Desmophyllum pertusum]
MTSAKVSQKCHILLEEQEKEVPNVLLEGCTYNCGTASKALRTLKGCYEVKEMFASMSNIEIEKLKEIIVAIINCSKWKYVHYRLYMHGNTEEVERVLFVMVPTKRTELDSQKNMHAENWYYTEKGTSSAKELKAYQFQIKDVLDEILKATKNLQIPENIVEVINCEEKEPKQLGEDETFEHNIDEERSTDDNSSTCDTDGELGDASCKPMAKTIFNNSFGPLIEGDFTWPIASFPMSNIECLKQLDIVYGTQLVFSVNYSLAKTEKRKFKSYMEYVMELHIAQHFSINMVP